MAGDLNAFEVIIGIGRFKDGFVIQRISYARRPGRAPPGRGPGRGPPGRRPPPGRLPGGPQQNNNNGFTGPFGGNVGTAAVAGENETDKTENNI